MNGIRLAVWTLANVCQPISSSLRYVNTNNFLRSIRNFKIDIRNTNTAAEICGIHWQVSGRA